MNFKIKKIITKEELVIIGIILIAIVCYFVSGCSSLVLSERERALDEAFERGKIDKIQYLSSKNNLQQEQTKIKK